jgi:hypothetical protein
MPLMRKERVSDDAPLVPSACPLVTWIVTGVVTNHVVVTSDESGT